MQENFSPFFHFPFLYIPQYNHVNSKELIGNTKTAKLILNCHV